MGTVVFNFGTEATAVWKLGNKVERCRDDLERLALQMDERVKESRWKLIGDLEYAMGRAHRLATVLRGDYDSIAEHMSPGILDNTVTTLRWARENADSAFSSLAYLEEEINEISKTTVAELKDTIKRLTDELSGRINTHDTTGSASTKALADLNKQMQDQIEHKRDLMQKLADTKAARMSFDIFGVFNGTTEDSAAFLEESIRKADAAILDTNKRMGELMMATSAADVQSKSLSNILAGLPAQQQMLELTVERAKTFITQAQESRDLAADMMADFQELEKDTRMLSVTAFDKNQLARVILRLCHKSLIDTRLIDDATMIRAELVQGYAVPDSPPMNDRVQNELAILDERLDALPKYVPPPPRHLTIIGATYAGIKKHLELKAMIVQESQTLRIDTHQLVRDLCRGQDPKPGVPKVLTMLYEYEGLPKAVLVTHDGKNGVIEINERAQSEPFNQGIITEIKEGAHAPGRPANETVIWAAIWGPKLITSDHAYQSIWGLDRGQKMYLSNESFGEDPWPGVQKTGTFYFQVDSTWPIEVYTSPREGQWTWYPKDRLKNGVTPAV
ncbi:hypothetical protein B0I37DRAFT_374390 [Chaetomium sp. MPI-CAGE-AT-0009]|nr:hypothetical protein B0I37DRAFT_374390 [Chaetomium sp. MPI-CAGE-AT-0009]